MRREQLCWLLAPAHFLLALLLLKPYLAPESPSERDTWGAAESLSHYPVLWVVCAALTALIAVRPVWVGTRPLERRGLVWVGFSMFGWGFINMLLCLAVRDARTPDDIVSLAFFGTVFGGPSALLCALPFFLLTIPVLAITRRWERDETFDDRDALLRVVGLHALLIAVLVTAAVSFDRTTATTLIGKVTIGITAAYALALLLGATLRTVARRLFLHRVLRHKHPDYVVEATTAVDQPDVARWTRTRNDSTRLLLHLPTMSDEGAYRSNQLRTPVARL